jgi:hypothetical protein
VGYESDRFALDFAGEIGKAISRQEPLWPRDEQGPAVGAGMDRVEDRPAAPSLTHCPRRRHRTSCSRARP